VNGTSLTTEVRRAHKTWPFIDAIEKRHKLPARLLYAVGWRETHLQNIMGDFSQRPGESSPRHHGFGVWQRDSGAFGVGPAYLKNVRRQAMDAAELLAANFRIFDRWDAAVAAYNCGPGNVQKALAAGSSVDRFTAGGDYSHDVLATRLAIVRRRARPAGDNKPDPKVVPTRGYFRPGRHNELFTVMGKRFKVWLRSDIACAGDAYVPGPEFSTFDRTNVRKCQILMGDEPDGWFGQSQWMRLMTERPPRRPPSRGAAPVSGLRVTQGFGVKDSRYAAGEHTGVDFGDSGDDAILPHHAYAAAQRVHIGEEALCEGPVHYDHVLRAGIIGRSELTSCSQRSPHGAEVSGAHLLDERHHLFVLRWGVALHADNAGAGTAKPERNAPRCADGRNLR